MRKIEFFMELRDKLTTLPKKEIESRLEYFNEIIDDRIEEGMTEEEAIEALGSLDEIAAQITEEYNAENSAASEKAEPTPAPIVPEKKKSGVKGWQVALIILGAPLWLAILIGVLSVAIAVVAVLFSLIVTAYTVVLGLGVAAVACVVVSIVMFPLSKTFLGLMCLGAGLVLAGVTILICIVANKLTKLIIALIKKLFGRKEKAK